MIENTIESLRATAEAADAEAASLRKEYADLGARLTALHKEIAEIEKRRTAIFGWSRSGLLTTAEGRATRARAEMVALRLPALTVAPCHAGATETVRVEQLGPLQMRTTRGTFRRNGDGSWTSQHYGTIAPFDENAVREQIKATRGAK